MIVLDTHVWLWWLTAPDRLSVAASDAIAAADSIGVSTISCWEVGMLSERGRITLDRPVGQWVRAALNADGRSVAIAPDERVAVDAATLDLHGDPADRFIYATARTASARLVTRDQRLRQFDPTLTLW